MAPTKIVLPGPVSARLVQDTPGAAAAISVLGRSFVASYEGMNGRNGWGASGYDLRIGEEGTATLRLPNGVGEDGRLHRERFQIITKGRRIPTPTADEYELEGGSYRPGDEWIELYRDPATPIYNMTPIRARVTRTSIELALVDALWTQKKTRETTAGFWNHSPRDVIESYSDAWTVWFADGFEATGRYSSIDTTITTSDGRIHKNASDARTGTYAAPPGTLRLRGRGSGVGAHLTLDTPFLCPIGLSSDERETAYRVEARFRVAPFASSGSGVYVGFASLAGSTPIGKIYLVFNASGVSATTYSWYGIGSGDGWRTDRVMEPGFYAVAVEIRERWTFFYLNGKLLTALPSYAYAVHEDSNAPGGTAVTPGDDLMVPFIQLSGVTEVPVGDQEILDLEYFLARRTRPYLMGHENRTTRRRVRQISSPFTFGRSSATLSGNEETDTTRRIGANGTPDETLPKPPTEGDGRPYGHWRFNADPQKLNIITTASTDAYPFAVEWNTGVTMDLQLQSVDGAALGWPDVPFWWEGKIVGGRDDVGGGGTSGRILLSNAGHTFGGQFAAGAEYWERTAHIFPADFVTSPSGIPGVDEGFNIFFEHHHTGSVYQEQAPVRFAVQHYDDGRSETFYVFVRGGTNNGVDTTGYTDRYFGAGMANGSPAPYEFERGARFDFKLHTINGSDATGLLEVWQRKNLGPWKLWFSYAGPNIYAGLSEYKEVGYYRRAYSVTTRVLFGDYRLAPSEHELTVDRGSTDGSIGVFGSLKNFAPQPLTGWAPFSGYSHALSSDYSKFDSTLPAQSVKVSWVSGANGTIETIDVTFTSAGVKTISLWLLVPAGVSYIRPIVQLGSWVGATYDNGSADFLSESAPRRGIWTKWVKTFTVAAGDLAGQIVINRGPGSAWTTGDAIYVDGVSAVDGAADQPFDTNSAGTPSRAAALLQIPQDPAAPLLDKTQGAIVFRTAPTYASADAGGTPVFWGYPIDANNEMHVYYDGPNTRWQLRRRGNSVNSDCTLTQSFLRNSAHTIGVDWTALASRLSVDGRVPSGGATSLTANPLLGTIPSAFALGSFLDASGHSDAYFFWAILLDAPPADADWPLYHALPSEILNPSDLPAPSRVKGILRPDGSMLVPRNGTWEVDKTIDRRVAADLGALPASGLSGDYYDETDVRYWFDQWEPGAPETFLRPTNTPSASRIDRTIDFPFSPLLSPPVTWMPAPRTKDAAWMSARWVGSIYLDLAGFDYQIRADASSYVRAWVGRTRFTEPVLQAWPQIMNGIAVPDLPMIDDTITAYSGSLREHLGRRSGWYPLVIEFAKAARPSGFATFAQIQVKTARSDSAGDWSNLGDASDLRSCPISPLGIYKQQVRNESHYDQIRAAAEAAVYQIAVSPRQVEADGWPGQIVPSLRLGRDTEKILDGRAAVDVSNELSAETVADALVVDTAGLADDEAGGSTVEVFNFSELGQHLIVSSDAESLAEIIDPEFARDRAFSLLGLKGNVFETIDARPADGGRQLLDRFPVTGELAAFDWAPGDGVRLKIEDTGIDDLLPRQILGVQRDAFPDGLGLPSVSFRQRPRSVEQTFRDMRRGTLALVRNYQGSLVVYNGTLGTVGVAGLDTFSRIVLPDSLQRIRSLYLVVMYKSDATPWNLEIHGVTATTVNDSGRYDLTSYAAQPAGGQYRMYSRLLSQGAGSTGTAEYQLVAEVLI